jgi:hypothetical protein
MKPKTSLPTDIVLSARKKYPDRVQAVKSYMGDIPYLKERLDPRTADKRLLQMDPNTMAELARTDPVAAEESAQRIATLEARQAATPPAPLQDDYEPE